MALVSLILIGLAFALLVFWLGLLLTERYRFHIRHRESASWPWAPASILKTRVRRRQSGKRTVYEAAARCSYVVEGVTYECLYSGNFGTKAEAEHVLTSMKELPPPVRYRPINPADSLVDPFRDAGVAFGGTPDGSLALRG